MKHVGLLGVAVLAGLIVTAATGHSKVRKPAWDETLGQKLLQSDAVRDLPRKSTGLGDLEMPPGPIETPMRRFWLVGNARIWPKRWPDVSVPHRYAKIRIHYETGSDPVMTMWADPTSDPVCSVHWDHRWLDDAFRGGLYRMFSIVGEEKDLIGHLWGSEETQDMSAEQRFRFALSQDLDSLRRSISDEVKTGTAFASLHMRRSQGLDQATIEFGQAGRNYVYVRKSPDRPGWARAYVFNEDGEALGFLDYTDSEFRFAMAVAGSMKTGLDPQSESSGSPGETSGAGE